MIEYASGNLLEADVEALVNTVNCIGVMGKGIALQFKQAYPKNFNEYEEACKAKEVQPGKMFTVSTGMLNPKYIINFPTKRHWRGKSKIEDIKSGLVDLIKTVKDLGIRSIAVPPLGCGNGGLDWNEVRPLIEQTFEELPDVQVKIYPPKGSPEPDKMIIGTERPKMTKSRALLIALMKEYAIPGYRLSMLEIQKLAYFLQVVGEPLRLRFVKHFFGPYAENLNHVLQVLEGHYIRGYGDRSKDTQVYILPNATEEALKFLVNEVESLQRLERVLDIITGFETPYGMELLSTVHWVVKEDPRLVSDPNGVVKAVHSWNQRKKQIFKEDHIIMAFNHLKELNMLRAMNSIN